MKEIIKKVRQGLIEVDNAIHSEFNKQVDSLGSWDLLCHNVALLEAVIAKQESDSEQLLNPRRSNREMSDAWHQNIPDVFKAIEALRNCKLK